MQIAMLKSKLHRATVTGSDLNYEGSISIDTELIDAARFRVNEKVDVYNCNTGARFSTYVIPGTRGQICLNGAAARLVQSGDQVIIVSYALVDESEADGHRPVVLILDPENRIKDRTDGH
ncbi:aspartate 1-decarboxylase [uncultured Desulfosarcina sp.]|uniref:aspartate 1-decarboxylase n=1 Tax=uncultured Desulfosarcina sp. TaxID=218289 RepID=UPI0029C7DAAD|nr:aspartate 1-decarboxylase [uncultured Desulfosarcina sp.]